jgi:hypothetical protein
MIAFDHIFELSSSIIFLVVGIWATAYGYGLAGDRLVGGLQWRPSFKRHLRWLGPLLIALCLASFFII